jgi:hypothetical protein
LGDLLANANQVNAAEHEYDGALYVFPDYHLALAAKARARVSLRAMRRQPSISTKISGTRSAADTAIALGDLYAKLVAPTKRENNMIWSN